MGLAGAGGGWYWENVYRTNVQTAYNAGRALAFDAVNPVALELVGVGDARQTEVCRRLTQPPVRRLYTDGFWKTHWPPFHFGCRTTVRAIYDPAELEEEPLTEVPAGEEPAAGFGTNPLSSGNWWRELKSMAARAEKYGVQGEIDAARRILLDRRGKVIKNYKSSRPEDRDNMEAAEMIADYGKTIELLEPDNRQNKKNADAKMDGEAWEIKTNRTPTKSAIDNALRAAAKQADRVILHVLSDIPEERMREAVKNRFRREENLKEIIILTEWKLRQYDRETVLSW